MENTRNFSLEDLNQSIQGKIFGSFNFFNSDGFTGLFTVLNDAKEGDIVIRHWINGKGIEIAKNKNISCLITENPKDDAIEIAEKLNFPLIVTEKIELANAFALKWTIDTFSPNSKNIAITGTNGKSTTSHLIYHILNFAGFKVFTNTDAESEFNTLIDPVVSKMISDYVKDNGKLDYLVIEISEVQGWLGSLMENHAALMSKSLNPDIAVVTNIAMDHIGLVNSIDEVFLEIAAFVKSLKKGTFIYNGNDDLLLKLLDFKNNSVNDFSFSMKKSREKALFYDNKVEAIFYNDKKILNKKELPFESNHFIQDILSAIAVCINLDIPLNDITSSIKNYKSLSRRFTKLNEKPLIIDDFAHNPEGIKATISETAKLTPENSKFHVICSIRGSRGEELNKLNAEALVDSIGSDHNLILTSSCDVVDKLNYVEENERNIFLNVLTSNNINFKYYDRLFDALNETYLYSSKDDVILLIGAQGMDSAEKLLKEILIK
ncbi:MAG: UDP-N-acetylmuramyl peptide synthase [Methanobacteriaceae archaeon]|jgi:UDP-N-acetylmuramate--alanine ligase/UDP-N-acetylmuramoyl-L-alanyl-D-glutamate--2,6-diaminopimelate ligase|nr:UDP-N-acetylmuramyl peptide synthase [Methanobacteriaceae archaeon]